MRPIFIAEVKTESPFGFKAKESWEERLALACEHGDWVAVHVDPRWGGSLELLEKARKFTKKPLLAKGAQYKDIGDWKQLGADYVHCVGVRQYTGAIQEAFVLEDLADIQPHRLVMWNSRWMLTGGRRPATESFSVARRLFRGWLCQASFIKSLADVHPDADAFIVGEHLPEFVSGSARGSWVKPPPWTVGLEAAISKGVGRPPLPPPVFDAGRSGEAGPLA